MGYDRHRGNGQFAKKGESVAAIEPIFRFWQKVGVTDDGCWMWRGAKNSEGYASLRVNGKLVKAHRFAYEYFMGVTLPDPKLIQPDHTCRHKDCVNPWHLELVEPRINYLRSKENGVRRNKTHCPRGHPYDEANTYYRPTRRNRICKICRRERNRRWYQ